MDSDDCRRTRFERVFEKHHAAIRAYALRRTDLATAQDAVSENFLFPRQTTTARFERLTETDGAAGLDPSRRFKRRGR